MGMRSTTQAFQFDVPFEQLFQLAAWPYSPFRRRP